MIWIISILGGLFCALILGPVVGLYLFNASKARELVERRAWETEVAEYLAACERIRAQRLPGGDIDLDYYDGLISQFEETQHVTATDFTAQFTVVRWN